VDGVSLTAAIADSGLCLIDEFDKMNEQDRANVKEAMGSLKLQAKCGFIVAANAVDLTDPMLSCFDIICIVKDDVDSGKPVVLSHDRSHEKAGQKRIDEEILKKYISYATNHVFPGIPREEGTTDKILTFYDGIQKESETGVLLGVVEVTAQHVNSIISIAKANARMELRDVVSARDVDNAIATMLESFIQKATDEVADKIRRRFSRYLGK